MSLFSGFPNTYTNEDDLTLFLFIDVKMVQAKYKKNTLKHPFQ